jgi:hypothetical protein
VKQQLSGNGGSQQNPSAHGSQGGR